jgi:hypothetical protein
MNTGQLRSPASVCVLRSCVFQEFVILPHFVFWTASSFFSFLLSSLFSLFICLFRDRVWLCRPGWPQTHNPPTSASRVLGLQACPILPGPFTVNMVL